MLSKAPQLICSRGHSKLGFLRRNLKGCPPKLRDTAYSSLVRPHLEYSCTVWDPYQKGLISKLEMVQRKAARFAANRFRRTDSVSAMLHDLGWQSLDSRREDQRLLLLYKITNGLVFVPTEGILIPRDRHLRANHGRTFKHIQPHCQKFRHSFFPDTIPIWNSLTFGIAEAASVDCFKLKLKQRTIRSPI